VSAYATNPGPAGEPGPPVWLTTYDARGRPTRTCAPPGSVTYTAYDALGRRIGPAAPPGAPPEDDVPPDEPHVVG
jgi:YD repeat-containing protein